MPYYQELENQLVVFSEKVVKDIQRVRGILPTLKKETLVLNRRIRKHPQSKYISLIDVFGELDPPKEGPKGFRLKTFWEKLVNHAVPLKSIVDSIQQRLREIGTSSYGFSFTAWIGIFGKERIVRRVSFSYTLEDDNA
ncbi:MAG: hypothetical protein ACW99G_23910 [Candidatus Thorarchaeota archaeon]|jgi:hypothetical protein